MMMISAWRPQKLYRDSTYAAKSPNITLKTVAQKLVTSDSSNAKIASGVVSAVQNGPKPLLVPKRKIEASGKSTRGSIIPTIVAMLSGRMRSNPRTCRIGAIIVLISSSPLYFVR